MIILKMMFYIQMQLQIDHGEEPADENKCALAEQDAADIFNTPG